ncbi:hypothetical protein D3C87_1630630 [compost metagenome]
MLFTRHGQAGLALPKLLQQAIVLAARHKAAIQQGLGLHKFHFQIIQFVFSHDHGARGAAHFRSLPPVLHPDRLFLGLQPGALSFGSAAIDVSRVQFDQHLPRLDLIAVGKAHPQSHGVEGRNQVNPISGGDPPRKVR